MKEYLKFLVITSITVTLLSCALSNSTSSNSTSRIVVDNQDDEQITYSFMDESYKVTIPTDWTVALEQTDGWEIVNPGNANAKQTDQIMGVAKDPKNTERGLSLVAIRFAQENTAVLQINTRDVSKEPGVPAKDLLEFNHNAQEEAGWIVDEEGIIRISGLEATKMRVHDINQALIQIIVLGEKTQYAVNMVTAPELMEAEYSYYDKILESFEIIE